MVKKLKMASLSLKAKLPFLVKINEFGGINGAPEPGGPNLKIGVFKLIDIFAQFLGEFVSSGCQF